MRRAKLFNFRRSQQTGEQKGANIPQQQTVPPMPEKEKKADEIRGTKKQKTEIDKAVKTIIRYMIETGATKIEAKEKDLGFELYARFDEKEGGRT